MFRNKYSKFEILASEPGSHLQNDYKMKVFDDGTRDLVVVGQIDIYEMIQSHRDSVDLKLTLERFARGDDSAVNRRQAFFGDFSNMPTSLAELSQRILDAQDLFNSLDVDARRAFDFDAGKFFASIGTPEFDAIVQQFQPKPETPIIPNASLNATPNVSRETSASTVESNPVVQPSSVSEA